MALPPSNTNTTSNSNRGTRFNTFTPPVMPDKAGLVSVILLQEKGTEADGTSDPRQNASNRNGTRSEAKGQRTLMKLVAVNSLMEDGTKVCFPDPTLQYKMPAPGTPELKALLAKPSGLFIRGTFAPALARLRADMLAGDMDMNFSVADLDNAIANNSLNSLLPPSVVMEQLGYATREEWTIGDIMFGAKTLNVQLLAPGLGDAYSDSFTKLRGSLGWPNVAFKCYISPEISVTELAGGPSYSVSVFFEWAGGELNPEFAMSGAPFATSATTAADASALAKRSAKAGYEGRINGVNDKMLARQRERMLQTGQNTTVPVLGGGGL
jgi:hypothetical protein